MMAAPEFLHDRVCKIIPVSWWSQRISRSQISNVLPVLAKAPLEIGLGGARESTSLVGQPFNTKKGGAFRR